MPWAASSSHQAVFAWAETDIGGHSHGRDLPYLPKLFNSYNTEAKIFETLDLARQCGINTIEIDPRGFVTVVKYNQHHERKIQTLIDFPPPTENKTEALLPGCLTSRSRMT